jgi:hypothetical protein
VIEKALLDKAMPLPADLAKQCQELLDERVDALRLWITGTIYYTLVNRGKFPMGKENVGYRALKIYDLAGEVTRASNK